MEQLLENFWIKNELENFSTIEIALFHYLALQITQGKEKHSNPKLCDILSTSEKTLIKARETLVQKNIITYQSGSKREVSKYQIGSFE